MDNILRVGAKTPVKKLANAIMMVLQDSEQCELISIGAASTNQAVKAIASANGLASTTGHTLISTPYFKMIHIDNDNSGKEERTALVHLIRKVKVAEVVPVRVGSK